jgi:hypothetical protein
MVIADAPDLKVVAEASGILAGPRYRLLLA